MKNFVLIGSGGYIAPRHIKAIKDIGGNLISAFDPNISTSIKNVEAHFPNAKHFSSFELLYLDIVKAKLDGQKIDYISIASPNFLHTSHIVFALQNGANAICEKPLVLDSKDLKILHAMEKSSGKGVYSILQLRSHTSLVALKKQVENTPKDHIFSINLAYIASRDEAYLKTWKGDESLSGGIAANIGIHFFDMLFWIFGDIKSSSIKTQKPGTLEGQMKLKRADVEWKLSIDKNEIPSNASGTTYRSITVDGVEIDFSSVQNDLHTEVYKSVIAGETSFGLLEAERGILGLEIVLGG